MKDTVTQLDRPANADGADAPGVFQRLDRNARFPYRPDEYARRALWLVVQRTLFRFSPPRAYGWRRWLLRCFGARLAQNTGVQASVRVTHPWLLEMGEWSMLGYDVVVYNLGRVTIGSHTAISQGVYLCAGTHDYTKPEMPLVRATIVIGSGVWVAAQVFVGPGVTVGDNSVVGARAVVTGDVPPGVVAAGNPCKVIKAREMTAEPHSSRGMGASPM